MSTRAMGPMAGVRWLMNAINLGRNNPKAVFGGAALTFLVMLVPSLVTLPLQLGGPPSAARMVIVMGVSMLLGLLATPLYGGMLSIIDAAENGRAARALDVFSPYRSGGGAPRMIGFALGMLLVYAVGLVVILGIAGTGIFQWYMQLMAAQGTKVAPEVLQQLPSGFGTAMALMFVMWLLVTGIYAVGFGQVVFSGRSPLAALKDGFIGSVKNLLPLLMMFLAVVVALLVVAVVFAVLAGIAALVGKFVGLWLMFVLLVPLYIAFVLTIFVVMFGVMYFMWRDVCGGSDTNPQAVAAMAA